MNKINRKKKLFCAFIDYEKAFDLVDRVSLWNKLLSYNINGKILRVIFNIYQKAKACVKLNDVISSSFPCNIGVRQGDNISPLLFSLFLNDFRDFIANRYNGLTCINNLAQTNLDMELESYILLYILLYADDTIILAENAKELQLALNALADYCQIWKLNINIDKTKIMRFSKRKSKNPNIFTIEGKIIENVDNYIYLGTNIKFNGKFHEAQNKQLLQAKKALWGIFSQKDKLQLPLDIYLNLFDTMVLPVLLYGCEIWGYENIEKLEIFFRSFLKKTLKLNYQTPNCMVYGESGRKPLKLTIQLRIVNFWIHILDGSENKLVFHMYKLLRKLHNNNTNDNTNNDNDNNNKYSSPWINNIEKIFNECGMGNLWLTNHNHNLMWVKNAIKLRLSDMYYQKWHSNVTEMSSCIFYKMFKNNLILENYLLNLNVSERINLCKFRCRNTKLPVIVLGYASQSISRENRLCTICDLNEVGDEYHYIMRCCFFQNSRQKYLGRNFCINPNLHKFAKLFMSNDVSDLRNLAKFVREINIFFL